MYTNTSFTNVSLHTRKSSGRRQGSFDCSAQSILAAMNRFVGSVQSMQSTVLVPSRLRDVQLDAQEDETRQLPAALINVDAYALFGMLAEVKNELLWGPGTGQSTVATMGSAPQPNVSPVAQMVPKHAPLIKCQSSASLITKKHSVANSVASSGVSSCVHPHHLANSGKALSNGNLCKEPLGGSLMASRGRLGHAMLSSDDGFGSLDSTASSSESLSEDGVESDDCDSMLNGCKLTQAPTCIPTQIPIAQHCNSSHLATAFKYHLQGLHTILHQLSDSADYLVDQYQTEVMSP